MRIPLLLTLLLLAGSGAVDAAETPLDSAKVELQRAVNAASAPAISRARAAFLAQAAADPKSATAHYWVAVADWRLAPMLLQAKDRKQASAVAKDGIGHCDRAAALDPSLAEAWALKAGLQGLMISIEPSQAMSLGPQTDANLDRARTKAADDPRIWLLDGINTLHKPGFFGGGPQRALEKLEKAQQLFEAPSASTDAFGWGRDDAWLWAGRCAMKLERYADAEASFARALEINPENRWVSGVLLPAAKEARAKQASR